MAEQGLLLIGVDHHESPVSLREALAIGPAEIEQALTELQGQNGVQETLILSTCNRMEILIAGTVSASAILDFFAARQEVNRSQLEQHSYVHENFAAVHHLFRVAASLESLVIGEYQIQHQVKAAYEQAVSQDAAGPVLHRLCQAALQCGKRVRTETALGQHRLSVASIAVDLVRQVHDRLDRCHLVLVGAGEMSTLCAKHLFEAGLRKLTVVNRSRKRAEALVTDLPTEMRVDIMRWHEMADALAKADIVISGTSASSPVITTSMVRKIRKRPQVYIDLAVPRDIEAGVGDLVESYCFNVDDLDRVVAANKALRAEEVSEAEVLVEQIFDGWKLEADGDHRDLAKRVGMLCNDLVGQEWDGLSEMIRDSHAAPVVEQALRRLGKRFQHRLMQVLKTGAQEERQYARNTVHRLLEVTDRRTVRKRETTQTAPKQKKAEPSAAEE